MDFLTDLWSFLKERKKFWLVPVVIVLLLLGILIVFGGSSALAPFIYTLSSNVASGKGLLVLSMAIAPTNASSYSKLW